MIKIGFNSKLEKCSRRSSNILKEGDTLNISPKLKGGMSEHELTNIEYFRKYKKMATGKYMPEKNMILPELKSMTN